MIEVVSPDAMETVPFEFSLKQQQESFETTQGSVVLTIECLENLDRTIDSLFEWLQKESKENLLEELCPYFGVIWPSARALASLLASQSGDLRGQKILEIGCGLAIPSLLASKLGAEVIATDFHPEVPRFLERNCHLNQISKLQYIALDWRVSALDEAEKFDWVIGSDILYERQQPALVAEVMAKYLKKGGMGVLADPGRPYLQVFADEMEKKGLHYDTQIMTVWDLPQNKDIFLLIYKA